MINTEVKPAAVQGFPQLMRLDLNDMIIIAISKNAHGTYVGTVVHPGRSIQPVGAYGCDWGPGFEPFNGEVILS